MASDAWMQHVDDQLAFLAKLILATPAEQEKYFARGPLKLEAHQFLSRPLMDARLALVLGEKIPSTFLDQVYKDDTYASIEQVHEWLEDGSSTAAPAAQETSFYPRGRDGRAVSLPASYEDANKLLDSITGLHKNYRTLPPKVSQDLAREHAVPDMIATMLPPDWSKRLANSVKLNFQKYVRTLDELLLEAKRVHPIFSKTVEKLATETYGKAVVPKLKGRKRCDAKGRFKYADKGGGVAWYRLTDVVRATILYDTVKEMYRGLDKIRASDEIEIVEFSDRYEWPLAGGYRDLQLTVRCAGFMCELQLNTHIMAGVKEASGHRSFEVGRELKAAIECNSLPRVQEILAWGKDQSLGRTKSSGTSLADLINDGGHLYKAASLGLVEIMTCLLDYGAQPNVQNKDGATPLRAAMAGGHERAVWALLCQSEIQMQIRDNAGNTPLLHGLLMVRTRPDDERAARVVSVLAQRVGTEEMEQTCERLKEELKKHYKQSTSLSTAAYDCNLQRMLEELNDFADPDSTDNRGVSAIENAFQSKNNFGEAVKMLLRAGANPLPKTRDGVSLWRKCIRNNGFHVLVALAEAAGVELKSISQAEGLEVEECLLANFTGEDCAKLGFDRNTMTMSGFSVSKLKDLGFSAGACFQCGFSVSECEDVFHLHGDERNGDRGCFGAARAYDSIVWDDFNYCNWVGNCSICGKQVFAH